MQLMLSLLLQCYFSKKGYQQTVWQVLNCVKLVGEPQKYIFFSPDISTFEIQKGKHARFFLRIATLTFGYIMDNSL